MAQQTITIEFEQYCNELVEKYQIPGFMIGVAKNGNVIYDKGFGYRNVEKQLPVTSDTVLGIGSVTKSFTSVAILQLQEAGKLHVDDPIVKYLPEFKTNNEEYTKQMTIHHFLTHSSGLPPMSTLFSALIKSIVNDPKFEDEKTDETKEAEQEPAKPAAIETYEELMEGIAKEEYTLLGAPGTEFSYSNDGYALLGAIIERVTGISYEQYTKDYILQPAGMTHSVFHLEELDGHDDISCLYNSRKKEAETIIFESNNPWDAPSMRAAGFLKSSVNDMLKFAEIFSNQGKAGNNQILSPESVEFMTTPYIECGHGQFYGYGLMIVPDFFGYKLLEHGGSIKGVAAQLAMIPELGLAGFSNANLGGVPSTKLLMSAFAEYLGKPVRASHISVSEIEVSEEELKEYVGSYVSNEGAKYDVQVENRKLNLIGEGLEDTLCKPFGNGQFLVSMREGELTLRFVRNEDKKVIRLSFGFRQIPKVV